MKRCFFKDTNHTHAHDEDVQRAPRTNLNVSGMRHPTYYCARCRRHALHRARWQGLGLKPRRALGDGSYMSTVAEVQPQ